MKQLLAVLIIISTLGSGILAEEAKDKTAAESPETLKYHIVVTATRTEQPTLELGSSTTVLTAKELEDSGKTTVAEALAAVPGLDVIQYGGPGKTASVFLRGANTEHTLVMIDGVEVNDPMSPGRTFDFAHLSLDNIDRIEIVRGPQGTLYGSDAMGGVINIITRKGTGKPRFFIGAETGSYNTFRESAGINGGSKRVNYSLEVSRFDSSGFSASAAKYGNTEKDGYGNTSLSARLGLNPLPHLDINLISRVTDAESDLDNEAGAGGDDPNYIQDFNQFLLAGHASLSLLDGKWEQQLGISYNRTRRNLDNDTDTLHPFDSSHGRYNGHIFKVDWQHNLYLHRTNTVTAGVEYERESGDSVYRWDGVWGAGESLFPQQSARTTGIYLQDNLKIREIFFMTLGVRFDHHSRFGEKTTFRLAPALVLKSGTKIKATYGTGFKAPSLYQLFAPATDWGPMGNPDLEPEKSEGWDVGIEQYLFNDRFNLSFTYFQNEFRALIDYDSFQGYINIAEAETKGCEIFLSALPLHRLTLRASYTYTEAKNKVTDENLLRRPRHKANLWLSFRFLKKAHANLEILHVGQRDDLFPYPTRTTADAYTLFNLAASYRLTNHLEIFGRIDNMFDREYEAVLGYGTPGRSAYIGIKARY